MGSLTPEMRVKVPLRYKAMFEKDLKSVIKKEVGNRAFGQALQYLALPPDEAECAMIHDACKGYVLFRTRRPVG
jgi:hypothetical protein